MNLDRQLAAIDRLRRQWSPPTEPVAARRRAHAAWANAGIEGNPVPWPRAAELLADPLGSSPPALQEIVNCRKALAFMETMSPPLRLAQIRELHALVMHGLSGGAGTLRSHEVSIVKQSGPDAGKPVFQPPHPARLDELMATLLEQTAAAVDEHPALRAGRFHYEFQSIHPFQDGNGRVGRILSTWLGRQGWEGEGFYLAPAIARAGSRYYLALRAVRPDYESEPAGGLRPWLEPFCAIFADALRHPDPPAPEESPS